MNPSGSCAARRRWTAIFILHSGISDSRSSLKAKTRRPLRNTRRLPGTRRGGSVQTGYNPGHLDGPDGPKRRGSKILEDSRDECAAKSILGRYTLACVLVGLGEKEGAIDWLERDISIDYGFSLGTIRVYPILVPLHGNPRFEALAEKVVPLAVFASAEAAIKK